MTATTLEMLPGSYTLGEEVANAVTHGVGVALSIAGLTLLVVLASLYGDGWALASAIVYGTSLVLLYSASTLYHALPMPGVKHVLKILDHSAIYLLIAGTYTPFTLLTLRSAGGLWLFALVWGLAVLGVSLEAAWVYRPKWVSALIYIAMGWLVVGMIKPLVAALAVGGLVLLIAGGLSYTLGTAFYVMKRVPYMHAVWHVFVLAASVLQFLSVALYVFPRG
jgi:hemolysin III